MRPTAQDYAAIILSRLLDAADVPTNYLGDGIIETWIDVTDGDHEGAIRLHVDEAGASVLVATVYYDLADDDQPGRPVDDEEHATFPVTSTDAILYCVRTLAEEHGAT